MGLPNKLGDQLIYKAYETIMRLVIRIILTNLANETKDMFRELKIALTTDEDIGSSCSHQKILTVMTDPTLREVHKAEENNKNNKKNIPQDKNLNKVLKDYIGQYDGTQDIEDSDDEGARDNHTPPESTPREGNTGMT
jgi:hypothetical protein